MEKLWTTSEVARHLGIHEVDVEELVHQGKLTGYKLGGQFLRFRPSQVDELKRTVRFRANTVKDEARPARPWLSRARDALYFYDFYVISAACLAALIVYLIVSG